MPRIYENRTWVVRALMYGMVAFTGLVGWLYSLVPPENAPPATLADDIVMWVVGLGTPLAVVAMWIYARHYVVALDWEPERERLEVETTGWVGRIRISIPIADLRVGELRGEQVSGPIVVNTAWSALRFRGRRWPLIVDLYHGDVLDEDALYALEQGRLPPEPVEPRRPTASFRRFRARRQRRRR